jgi:hypothetical protein
MKTNEGGQCPRLGVRNAWRMESGTRRGASGMNDSRPDSSGRCLKEMHDEVSGNVHKHANVQQQCNASYDSGAQHIHNCGLQYLCVHEQRLIVRETRFTRLRQQPVVLGQMLRCSIDDRAIDIPCMS